MPNKPLTILAGLLAKTLLHIECCFDLLSMETGLGLVSEGKGGRERCYELGENNKQMSGKNQPGFF